MSKKWFLLILLFTYTLTAYSFNFEYYGGDINADSIYALRHKGEYIKAKAAAEQWVIETKDKFGEQSVNVIIPLIVSSELAAVRDEFYLAIDLLDEAREIMLISSEWLYPDYAITLNYLAFCYIRIKNPSKAAALLKEIDIIYEKTLGKDHPDYNPTNINKGILYMYYGDYEKSESFFQIAINFNSQLNANSSPNQMRASSYFIIALLGELYSKWNKFEKAEELLIEIYRYYQEEQKFHSSLYKRVLFLLGNMNYKESRYNLALSYFNEQESICKKLFGSHHISYYKSKRNIAKIYRDQGNLFLAKKLYQEILQYQFNGKDYINFNVESLLNLSEIYLYLGDIENAEVYYKQAKELPYIKEDLDYFMAKIKAKIELQKEDIIKAEITTTELIAIAKSNNRKKSRHYIDAINILSELFIDQGRFSEALELSKEELQVLTRHQLSKTLSYTTVQFSYAKALLMLDQDRLFEEFIEKIGNDLVKYSNNQHYLFIYIYFYQGLCEEKKGNFENAIDFYQKGVNLSKKLNINQKSQYILMKSIASVYQKKGNHKKAVELYSELDDLFDDNSFYKPSIKARLAYNKFKLGKKGESEKEIIMATNLRLKQFDIYLKNSSEEQKIHLIHSSSKVFDYFYTMFLEEGDQVSYRMIEHCYRIHIKYQKYFLKEAEERRDNITLLENYRKHMRFSSYAPTLYHKKDQLSTYNYMDLEERAILSIDANQLKSQINNLEKSLVYTSSSFREKEAHIRSTWKPIQNTLSDSEVLIEIKKINHFEAEKDQYYAFIISPLLDRIHTIKLGKASLLETKNLSNYSRHSKLTRSANNLHLSNYSHSDYDSFWEPIQSFIENKKLNPSKIYFTNDGVYHLININTLLNPVTEKYLIEDQNVKYLSHSYSLFEEDTLNIYEEQITLIGAPSFGENKYNLAPLPGTLEEIDSISTLFKSKGWKVTSFIDSTASEENFKKINHTNILHIATHGFYFKKIKHPIIDNSLLKSGVFLSEVNDKNTDTPDEKYNKGIDGILTAYEVKELDLRSTELLVLSACESGLFDLSDGDGVSGLQYAFKIAGVDHIIMSLWDVDDHATQLLMRKFYERFLETKDINTSFKEAQLFLKEQFPEPYFWGAFVLIH